MGTLVSAISPLLQIGSALGTVAGIVRPFAENAQAERHQKQADAAAERALAQNIALQKQQNKAASDQAEESRRSALKRAVSRQMAISGAKGTLSDSGSSEAVLLGQFLESDQERQSRERLDSLRDRALDQSLFQKRQTNLLEQEQKRQRNLLSSIGDLVA